jgi:tetratricopeptide (TPR) repeat protein
VVPAALLCLAGAVVYSSSLDGPFVFDDHRAIVENPTIRALWPPWTTGEPHASALTGRPVATLTFAINYAIGGLDVRGYHATNVAIHLLAALVLFGVVRRTLLSPGLAERWSSVATPLGWSVALVWVVHPLATEAVSYTVQRTESLMALFYLLTLYAAIRGRGAGRPARWWLGAVVACALGMATKEVMVTCPVTVWLHDFSYAGRGAWRARKGLYVALGGTWLVLVLLMTRFPRPGSVGFDLGIGAWGYLRAQCVIVWEYLLHALWPAQLVFDYGAVREIGLRSAILPGLGLVALLGLAAAALVRRSPAGFPGVWFFLVLAPTSSWIPVATEIGAERRMYLPLAAVVVLAVCGVYRTLERLGERWGPGPVARRRLGVALLAIAVVALGAATFQRNRVYRTEESIWRSAVRAAPGNARAHTGLGRAILDAGRSEEALGPLSRALVLDPDSYDATYNLGSALSDLGRFHEALGHLVRARDLRPDRSAPHYRLGLALLQLGRPEEAAAALGQAARLAPDSAPAREDLAIALARAGRIDEAIERNLEGIRLDPGRAASHNNLANLYQMTGRSADAVESYRRALDLDPTLAEAHHNLGVALIDLSREEEALEHLREALRLRPDFGPANRMLGLLLARRGEGREAVAHLRRALELDPRDEDARRALEGLEIGAGTD